MISRADVDKLLSVRAAGPSVLSLYLRVPLDPGELRGLPARAGDMFALAARGGAGTPGVLRVGAVDRRAVRGLLAARARDWLGTPWPSSAALSWAWPRRSRWRADCRSGPCSPPGRMCGHCWPRCPAYHVLVVDRRHSWLFAVTGERIETTALPPAEGLRSQGFSGWYGLEACRVNDRIIELARHHYHDTAALLERAARVSGPQPLVIGGHDETIPQFLAVLPAALRDQFAGRFVADSHTLTPARVRDLAGRVIEDWLSARDQHLLTQILQQPPDGLTATGLHACLTAAASTPSSVCWCPQAG